MTSSTTASNGAFVEQQAQRALAVRCDDHFVPIRLEVEAEPIGEVLLVLDDEDALPGRS
jgi:hypothetical protein